MLTYPFFEKLFESKYLDKQVSLYNFISILEGKMLLISHVQAFKFSACIDVNLVDIFKA